MHRSGHPASLGHCPRDAVPLPEDPNAGNAPVPSIVHTLLAGIERRSGLLIYTPKLRTNGDVVYD